MKTIHGASLVDHTVDGESGEVFAGFLVSYYDHIRLGFVWTEGGVWHWRSASGQNFGERGTKAAAVEALVQAFEHYARQRGLPYGGERDGLIGRAKTAIRSSFNPMRATTPHKAAPAKSAPAASPAASAPTPKPRGQEINWGAGASLNPNAVAAAFRKQGSK